MATITATPNPSAGVTRLTITSPRIVEEITRLDANGLAPVRVRPGVLPYLPDTVTGRTNLSTNPRGIAALPLYAAVGTVTPNVPVSDHPLGITTANRLTYSAGASNPGVTTAANLAPNTAYVFSAYVKHETAPAGVGWSFAHNSVGSAPAHVPTVGAWERVSWTHTTPASPSTVGYRGGGTPTVAGSFLITGIMHEKAAVLGAYFDGFTPDDDLAMYGWDGSANNSTSSSTVDAGALIIDDYEAAHGEATYTVREQFTFEPTEPARTTATTTLDGPWIMVPVSPDYSRRVETINEYSQARASLSTELQPLDRSDVIVIMRPLGARRGRLGVVCGSYADAAALEDTCNRGEIVMLRQPEHAGMDMYFYVQQANLTPLTKDGGRTRWGVDLAYVSVTRPEGDQNGAIGWDFADVAAAYADFEAIADAFLDFEALEMRDTA